MGDEREFKIKMSVDAASAVTGTQQAAQGFEKTAESVGKAADEAERYQKALQKMAESQAAGQGKQVSAEDQAMVEKAAARKAEIAERKNLALAADQEIADGVKTVTQAEVDAATQVAEADDKSFASKKQLKAAVKGLQEEFPMLAHVARLALNPITLAVTLAASAWAIWKSRIDAVTKSLGGVEMPDVADSWTKAPRDAGKAWGEYADAIGKVVQRYNEAEAASTRMIAALREELSLRLASIKAINDYAAAKLEAEKSTISPTEYNQRKQDLAGAAKKAESDTKWQADQAEWYAKNERNVGLRQEAEAKEKAARRIKVGEAGDYAGVERGYKSNAEQAEKAIKESEQWVNQLNDLQKGGGGFWQNLGTRYKARMSFGNGFVDGGMNVSSDEIDELIRRETEKQASSRVAINQNDNFQRAQKLREEARQRRSGLLGEAAQARGAAATGEMDLGDQAASMAAKHSADARNSVMEALASAYRALAEINAKAAELSKEVQKAKEAGTGTLASVLEELQRTKAERADQQKRIAALEGRAPRTSY